jgi:hypothetical protein
MRQLAQQQIRRAKALGSIYEGHLRGLFSLKKFSIILSRQR